MYIVRGKSGKVVGKYKTRAEAAHRIAQLKAGAERLRAFQFRGSRSPIRGRIGATGIHATAHFDVKPGHLYALGASSSPDIVYVTEVTDRIKFLRWPYTGKEQVIERWIGEDLIAKGTRNHLKLYGDRSILRGKSGRAIPLEELQEKVRREREEASKSPRRGRSPGVRPVKMKVYRGYVIKVFKQGTWCEAGIYLKNGAMYEGIGSGTCSPGSGTVARLIANGEHIIDAMHGE
jgi:hypothetical protein